MLAGFKEASGDAVVNISADLQDPIDLILRWSGIGKVERRLSFAIG